MNQYNEMQNTLCYLQVVVNYNVSFVTNTGFLITNDALSSHGGETPSEGLTKSSCGIETW
jgi:hypothetical protein